MPKNNNIQITDTYSDFEREKLKIPFGFKGGYLSELWQTGVRLTSAKGNRSIGLGTQSVLYGDPDIFSSWSEAGSNALMYALTERALQLVESMSFDTPVGLMEELVPDLRREARRITGKQDVNENFVLNALVGLDNAAWLLYAAETGRNTFEKMIPAAYKPALSHHNDQIGVMFQVSYGMSLEDIREAVNRGYFIIKIKTGQPGTQREMLQKDKDRLSEIHDLLNDRSTVQTEDGRILYTLDANGRYKKRETLEELINHAEKIGAWDHILFIEEPLSDDNEQKVSGLGIPIAADDSLHCEEDVRKRIEQGYEVIVLKGIAKTLSLSLKMARLAHKEGIPCVCSDLTVNPILVDWHKLLAAHLPPFPGLDMGIMETNGDMNYQNWSQMKSYHPSGDASWTEVTEGTFELGDDFYEESAGIFYPSSHYEKLLSVT
ncbi:enolase C-terminal domain-like protein [Fodinibius sediminis]|uniref:L-alanine-DL-glutamate epimerase n=1 Tax=Fodinibius sediminis TaxID=1214077 RepID=A0A521CVL5_9BACT|nr:enolase C-terminal domain-like protein [Fodinibius sediminis]SMO62710.1 L-alanine-DL-glutamate epimerase [Fodinibius sediminis]